MQVKVLYLDNGKTTEGLFWPEALTPADYHEVGVLDVEDREDFAEVIWAQTNRGSGQENHEFLAGLRSMIVGDVLVFGPDFTSAVRCANVGWVSIPVFEAAGS